MTEKEKTEADYLIVGQGLAGSVLTYRLMQAGRRVLIIDPDEPVTASKIAAGIITPVTGWRLVKSWRIDEFLPAAKTFYQEIGKTLDIYLWKDAQVVKAIKNIEEENHWLWRAGQEDYVNYCHSTLSYSDIDRNISGVPGLQPFRAFGEINQAAQVDVPLLIRSLKAYFIKEQVLRVSRFHYADLQISADAIIYKDIQARKIIFCEGIRAVENPFFNDLPFRPDKGELLVVRIPGFPFKKIFKNNISLASLGNNLFWAGATNEWHFEHENPTAPMREKIIQELNSMIDRPFEILKQQAAVRPTVADRRPLIGLHHTHAALCIFNGFGTKGTSLVPFWANHFIDSLENGGKLDPEIDVQRLRKKTSAAASKKLIADG